MTERNELIWDQEKEKRLADAIQRLERLERLEKFVNMQEKLIPFLPGQQLLTLSPPSGEWRLTSSADVRRKRAER